MQKSRIAQLIGLSILATSLQLHAEEELGFSGSGELGYMNTSGNKKSETLNAKLKINYAQETRDFSSILEAESKREKIDGENHTISERYVVELQADQYFDDARTFYAFANLRGEKDRIVDLDRDLNLTLGLGKVLYKTEASLLKGELGVGYQKVDFRVNTEKDFNQAMGRAKLDFNHKFNDTLTFVQDALYTYGRKQYKLETNTGFRASLTSALAAGVNYKYRYNSKPGEGNKKSDGEFSINLIYNF